MESKQKELPRLFSRPEDCCGCGGCQSVCSGEAIVMRLDEMVFCIRSWIRINAFAAICAWQYVL